MEIFATKKYDRRLAKLVRKNSEVYIFVFNRLKLLKNSPTHPSLRLHKLANRENEYAISIDHSIRLIFSREKDSIYLLDIGSHEEVY